MKRPSIIPRLVFIFASNGFIIAGILSALKSQPMYIAIALAVIVSQLGTLLTLVMIRKQFNLVLEHVENISAGHVTARLSKKVFKEFEILGASIDTMSKDMKVMIGKMLMTGEKLATSIVGIKETGNQLAISFENVAENVTDIAGSIDGISSDSQTTKNDAVHMVDGINQIADLSNELNAYTEEMRKTIDENTESSKQIIQILKDGAAENLAISNEVNDLKASMTNIEAIIQIITSISEQTNLLALNASIEAARAGDAGRGFAVVAEEVRKLAEQSSESTENIKDIIREVSDKTVAISTRIEKLVEESKNSITFANSSNQMLNQVTATVSHTTESVETISTLCQTQLSSTNQIFNLVEGVTNSAQDVTANVEEAAALTQQQSASITGMSESLEGIHSVSNDLMDIVEDYKRGLKVDSKTNARVEETIRNMKAFIDSKNLTTLESLTAEDLHTFTGQNKQYEFTALLNSEGLGIAFSDLSMKGSTIDVSYRPFYTEVLKNDSYSSEPYISQITDEFCITSSIPIRIDGRVAGVFVVDMTL
jgi:methyl-accepting chemotaxis protein